MKIGNVNKTVKFYSNSLSNDDLSVLENTLQSRKCCRNYFYARFSGIEYLNKLDFREIRNHLVNYEKDEMKKFHLPDRTWKMELSEVISNVKTMWTNTADEIKHYIRDNENLTSEDQHYLFYILKSKDLWAEALQFKKVSETKKLSTIQVSKDKSYL